MNLNLKKWMEKVSLRLASIPDDGSGWVMVTDHNIYDETTGSITLTRRGDVCTLKFNGVKLNAVSTRKDFLVIQAGFEPFTEVAMPFDSSNLWFFVRPDRTVAVNAISAATTVWGACTYLVKK